MVLVPLGAMAWLGVRLARSERVMVEQSLLDLRMGRLRDVEAGILKVIDRTQRRLLEVAGRMSASPEDIRIRLRGLPGVRQIFVLRDDGKVLHPDFRQSLTADEEAFLSRAKQVWTDRQVFFQRSGESSGGSDHGWYTWYHGSGVQLAFWVRRGKDRVLGFELDRYRLIADIIAELPASGLGGDEKAGDSFALLDSRGEALYHWGEHKPAKGGQPAASLELPAPLSPWRVVLHSSSGPEVGSGAYLGVFGALLAMGLALVGIALYFYRESTREIREAQSRVSFVNHVSHELKTPLTNIRMYAELLGDRVESDDERIRRYLEVLTTESERLSRLINNVLTFGRQRRGALKLFRTPRDVDEVIAKVVRSFAPSLEARGIRAEFETGAPGSVMVDADALEQILGNLLGNVEKYASQDSQLVIRSGREGRKSTVTVSNSGPGIPAAERERIFEPFVRLSDSITDGVAGTGIGLSISRELARLHGGDLVLLPGEKDVTFRLTLETNPAES
jgi:signal transduction histidine kinase